jgi:Nuclease-related domain
MPCSAIVSLRGSHGFRLTLLGSALEFLDQPANTSCVEEALPNRYAQLMAECSYFPNPPHFGGNHAEEAVFGDLLLQLPAEASLFHGVKYFDGDREHEIDFLIAHPEFGIALLEVKGGQLRSVAGHWEQYSNRDNAWHREDPAEQLGRNSRWIVSLMKKQFGNQLPPVRGFLVTPDSGAKTR